MSLARTSLLSVALVTAAALGFAQERTKDAQPKTFQELHAAVKAQYDAGSFGQALASSREMMGLIAKERSKVIRAALPAAPAGYEVVPQKEEQQQSANPFAAQVAASVGSVIEQEYKGEGGSRLQVTVTADSPMLAMAAMMFENPALLGPNAELIKYDECKAILKHEGNRWSLQILIDQAMVEARFGSEDDEFALKMFDQAAVTKLHTAIVE